MSTAKPRILIVDDNEAIHYDFRLILSPTATPPSSNEIREKLFGPSTQKNSAVVTYRLDSAFQGQEALAKVRYAQQKDQPYSVAFIDMRMPPGWDGLETIIQLHAEDKQIQLVMCTAYSDYSWQEIHERLGNTDRLLILKKPFDNAEVSQLATTLCRKYELAKLASIKTTELQSLVHERTQEVTALCEQRERLQGEAMERERRLLHKDKLESLGMLASGVAHDVNNLLHIVQNYISLSKDRLSNDDCSAGYLNQAHDAATEISTVVNRILEFSRHRPAKLKAINVVSALKRAAQLVKPLLSRTGHQLEVVFDLPPDTMINAEDSFIEQMIVNLCINACDATPEMEQIKINASVIPPSVEQHCDRSQLQIEVIDQGIGISAELQKKIFDPFFTTKQEGHGTGLGLATIQVAVRRHLGTIEVESTIGVGSKFRVVLPLADDKKENPDVTPDEAFPVTQSRPKTGQKILIADDAAPIRELAKLLLEDAGYVPILAVDGKQALELALEHDDLIGLILDVQMPHLSGYEVVAALAKHGRDFPVIYCSGNAPYEKLDAFAPGQTNGFVCLDKPFTVKEFMTAIEQGFQGTNKKVEEELISTLPKDEQ